MALWKDIQKDEHQLEHKQKKPLKENGGAPVSAGIEQQAPLLGLNNKNHFALVCRVLFHLKTKQKKKKKKKEEDHMDV